MLPSQTIIQLDQKTINKIAAGEVVERPASVIKELVENSIDAQASMITIQIKNCGLDEIRVIDNGVGMSAEDATIAWKSHTTSKLLAVEDLDNIISLGFRGEALASISAVSMFEILTRRKEDKLGTYVKVKGGTLEVIEKRECAPGTTITVKNLFFNVPARKKFLKSKTTELGHIIEIVTRQALIRSNIHFVLNHNNSELLNSPASKNKLDPIIAVFGVDLAKKLIPVEFENELVKIYGFASQPELSRSSRELEIFYVNKRFIKNTLLSEAVEAAYKTLLMKNRYPVVLLNLEINSSKIDVNIHPTKREIRFDDANSISEIITLAIKQTLESTDLWRKDGRLMQKSETKDIPEQSILRFDSSEPIQIVAAGSTDSIQELNDGTLESFIEDFSSKQLTFTNKGALESRVLILSDSFWIKPLGQALNLYILCESNDGIAIVDIHAAHERIRYEELLNQYHQSKIELQELLAPITFTLSLEQISFLQDYLPLLSEIGIQLEKFGGNTYIIRRLPVMMNLLRTEADIRDFFDEMQRELKQITDVNDRIDVILKTMACHSVVRGGDVVTLEKSMRILSQLKNCERPFTCPHGRPTIIRISAKDLEKEFGRIV
ncbi:MAG: DNA mismatch repair endonuclease MutL [Asgard group archaeon]|nr:DNA mismatch repair endonuclease MutL [Asgard group archaeon]